MERLPLNVGIGICLGMVPLAAYNFSAGNYPRMKEAFSAARTAGLAVSLCSVVLYRFGAASLVKLFISDPETVRCGTEFLRARCFATPLMFLSFNMVHFVQAIGKGRVSFCLAAVRQLVLNIPIMFLFNHLFGMSGIVWTQVTADFLNVLFSYVVFVRCSPAWFSRKAESQHALV